MTFWNWRRWIGVAAVAGLATCVNVVPRADEPTPDKVDSAEQDYRDELPRIAATSPADAFKKFHVAPGFRLEQVAAEPLVTDPIALAFDENGRLFVVEMLDYSEDDTANLGRIRLLEDTDADGRFDKSTIYVDGLSWPTGIACWNGGVFVGAAPDFFYFKDTDGDGKADIKQHLFTGFSRANVQGMLNSFQWGLDNRIHGSASSGGGDVRRVGKGLEVSGQGSEKKGPHPNPLPKGEGTGHTDADQPLALRGRDFALEPRTLALAPTSGGAQHGVSFDDWGRRFVCSNSDHIQLVMFEDRYLARNPYLAAPSSRISIAADGPQADVFRTSPVEPWRIVRTRLRVKGLIPGPVEGGGRAAGYFTGATGVTIYRGHTWPADYHGYAFVGDVGSNLIHRKKLESNGVGLIARRVDAKSEFVTSDDVWFRPVQFANAPDGALYVCDMYREVIEHPASLHPVIKKHLDLTSGRDRGRIYRLVSDDFQQPKLPKLGAASTAELVATLAHPNGWHRDTAARLIYERRDRAAIPLLETLAEESASPLGRMHALYALDGLDALAPEIIRSRLDDKHPRVRQHAVRLAEQVADDSPAVREKLFSMPADDDLLVRYQLAFTLGEIPGPQRTKSLAALAERDAADTWIRLAVRSSLAEGAGEVLATFAADVSFRQSAAGHEWLKQLGEQIGKQQRADDVAALLVVLSSIPASETATLQAIVQGLAAKPGTKLAEQIAAATGGRADALVKELVVSAAKSAADVDAKPADRVAAIQQLRLGRFAELQSSLAALLGPTQPAEVQTAALSTLASFSDARVAALLVQQWPGLSPRVRSQAADVLFSRPAWIVSLLDAVQREQIGTGDVDPGRWKLLADHRDALVRERAAELLSKLKVGRRGEVLEAYKDTLTMAGDAPRGKELFKKICAACHQLEGVGHPTGPNLAAMRNRGPDAILLNVLDPNRELNPQFLNYAVVTTDGRTLTGMITAETATSVTLKRADNATDTVLRIDIDQLKSTGVSLMPEGMERQIDKQAMADLFAYLKTID